MKTQSGSLPLAAVLGNSGFHAGTGITRGDFFNRRTVTVIDAERDDDVRDESYTRLRL
jgi:hypothetical protein